MLWFGPELLTRSLVRRRRGEFFRGLGSLGEAGLGADLTRGVPARRGECGWVANFDELIR